MPKTNYGYSVKTGLTFDDAIAKATEELKKDGFGVLTEIDVSKTLKEKLDFDFRRYRILGACQPQFASQALQAELEIGLLMPCNVIVYENDDKTATISLLSPRAQFDVTGRQDLDDLVSQVESIIQGVATRLSS